VDANHTMEYLKYAATRRLLTSVGREQNGNDRLSPVSDSFYTGSVFSLTIFTIILSQASLKKVMTMLGRVRRRQADDDPTLDGRRPASSTRGSDFCKALMVEAQRLRLEYVYHLEPMGHESIAKPLHIELRTLIYVKTLY
jgi:hypothetical protein